MTNSDTVMYPGTKKERQKDALKILITIVSLKLTYSYILNFASSSKLLNIIREALDVLKWGPSVLRKRQELNLIIPKARAYMYALCVSGAVNMQGFVWKFCMRYV